MSVSYNALDLQFVANRLRTTISHALYNNPYFVSLCPARQDQLGKQDVPLLKLRLLGQVEGFLTKRLLLDERDVTVYDSLP